MPFKSVITVNSKMSRFTNIIAPSACLEEAHDAISLHELGRLEITQASTIEFNNASQKWEVKDRRGKVRFFSRSRSACLDWEQTNLQLD